MKKDISVFAMILKSVIYKVLGVILLTAAAEMGAFCIAVKMGAISIENAVEMSHIKWIFILGFVFTSVLTMTNLRKISSAYTIRRLRYSEVSVYLSEAACGIICFTLLYAVQILTLFISSQIYVHMIPEHFISNQTVFLAFYRDRFLHSIMPLSDIWVWVRNIVAVIASGIAMAIVPHENIKFSILNITAVVVSLLLLTNDLIGAIGGNLHLIFTALEIFLIGLMLWNGVKKEGVWDEI